MVAAGEASVADLALEGFGAGVFPNVAREFVGAREPPQTVFVRARVWLFTRVNALMGLEMRTFCVNFGATWMVAVMNPSLLQLGVVPPIVFDDLTSRPRARSKRVLSGRRRDGGGGGGGNRRG